MSKLNEVRINLREAASQLANGVGFTEGCMGKAAWYRDVVQNALKELERLTAPVEDDDIENHAFFLTAAADIASKRAGTTGLSQGTEDMYRGSADLLRRLWAERNVLWREREDNQRLVEEVDRIHLAALEEREMEVGTFPLSRAIRVALESWIFLKAEVERLKGELSQSQAREAEGVNFLRRNYDRMGVCFCCGRGDDEGCHPDCALAAHLTPKVSEDGYCQSNAKGAKVSSSSEESKGLLDDGLNLGTELNTPASEGGEDAD